MSQVLPSRFFLAALSAYRSGAFSQSLSLLQRADVYQPDNIDVLNLLGLTAYQLAQFDVAEDAFHRIIAIRPNPDVYTNHGNALCNLGEPAKALGSYSRAIDLLADHVLANLGYANALNALDQNDQALVAYDLVLKLAPDFDLAHFNRGKLLEKQDRLEEALLSYDKAIELNPNLFEAYDDRGNIRFAKGQFELALADYDRAVAVMPDSADSHTNRGNAFASLGRYVEALSSYNKALAINPVHVQALDNCGVALFEQENFIEALVRFDQAIVLDPTRLMTHVHKGDVFFEKAQYELAASSYEIAMQLHDQSCEGQAYPMQLLGKLMYCRMHGCCWGNFDRYKNLVKDRIEKNVETISPFFVLALNDDLKLQKKAAKFRAISLCQTSWQQPDIGIKPSKIRLGYFSADFHEHATAYLMAELFELHDRTRFELYAFSFGVSSDSSNTIRARLMAGFDKFIDVQSMTNDEVVVLARSHHLDIAVDLKGYTKDARTDIFSARVAPVQINYLGYPGTMGADCIDYLVADEVLIPLESREGYTEKIIYLPNSYQVNDRKRLIGEGTFTREQLGLPVDGFVFCCFNNNFKIVPDTFDIWMRLLNRVDGSVLWLLQDNKWAVNNLRKEAQDRGVDPSRLVFAPRVPLSEHLARHRLADLFLDTLPYNAHTTTSDALWTGLPVLTCAGQSFASRVAASLLNAVGMPELVTSTPQEYEALALELATSAPRLQQMKSKLALCRLSTALFDTPSYCRHLEAAYAAAYQRSQAGLTPDHILIESK